MTSFVLDRDAKFGSDVIEFLQTGGIETNSHNDPECLAERNRGAPHGV